MICLMFVGPCIIVISEAPDDGHSNARNMLSLYEVQ